MDLQPRVKRRLDELPTREYRLDLWRAAVLRRLEARWLRQLDDNSTDKDNGNKGKDKTSKGAAADETQATDARAEEVPTQDSPRFLIQLRR